jgi:hypothetical protein
MEYEGSLQFSQQPSSAAHTQYDNNYEKIMFNVPPGVITAPPPPPTQLRTNARAEYTLLLHQLLHGKCTILSTCRS